MAFQFLTTHLLPTPSDAPPATVPGRHKMDPGTSLGALETLLAAGPRFAHRRRLTGHLVKALEDRLQVRLWGRLCWGAGRGGSR